MGSEESARISAQSFPTLPSARIEFNINASGLHIVANRAGWETLGMWCARMERAATEDHDDGVMARSAFELDPDVAPSEMLADGSIMTAFWGLGANPDDAMDVFFHASDQTGPSFWAGTGVRSGTSPGTHAFGTQMYWALDPLRNVAFGKLVERLGEPIGRDGETAYFAPDVLLREAVAQFDVSGLVVEVILENGRADAVNWIELSDFQEGSRGHRDPDRPVR